jgi:hypothetical protein
LVAMAVELFPIDCIELLTTKLLHFCVFCKMDLYYAKRWALTISLQIVADGSHNPSSNSLPTSFKFIAVGQMMVALCQWCYDALANFWRCEQWCCRDWPLALCKDARTKRGRNFWKLVNLSALFSSW